MEAQLQVRHNAHEAQEYVSDLLEWQQTIKKSAPSAPAASTSAPAVRGRAEGGVSAAPAELQKPALTTGGPSSTGSTASKPSAAHPASHTYKNYSKWDKFDVDSALEESDVPASSSSQTQHRPAPKVAAPANTVPTPSIPPPCNTTIATSTTSSSAAPAPARAKEPSTALEWKDRGNKLFQAGQFQAALECYQRSLALQPTSIAHANAAMALLKLNKHSDAEHECTAALKLDPTYVKALQRRGTARKALGSWLAAAEDFETGLRLEPSNSASQAERDACLAQYLQQQQLDPSYLPANPVQLVVEPTKQAQQQEQQQQQQQQPAAPGLVPISSSKTPEAAAASAAAAMQACLPATCSSSTSPSSTVAPPVTPRPATPPPSGSSPLPPAPADAAVKQQVQPHVSNQQAVGAAPRVRPSDADALQGTTALPGPTPSPEEPPTPAAIAAAASAAGSSLPQQEQQQLSEAKTGSPGKAGPGSHRLASAAAAAALAEKLAGRVVGQFKQPRTSVEFEAAWRALRGDTKLQEAYIARLDIQRLPAVFKSSLTADTMQGLAGAALRAVAAAGTAPAEQQQDGAIMQPAAAVQLLQVLSTVDRFEMAAMCCTGAQRQQLGQLWQAAEAAAARQLPLGLQGQLSTLRSRYRL